MGIVLTNNKQLLAKHLSEKSSALAREKTEAEEWAEWEVESAGSDSDSENEWKDVLSDSDSDINLSGSDSDSDAESKVEVIGPDGKVVEGKKKRASTNKRERKRRKIEKSRLESRAEEARLDSIATADGAATKTKKKNVNFVGLEDDSGDSYGEDSDDEAPVVELPVVDDVEEVEGDVALPQAKKEIDPQEQDEMSLTRATKVLEGTTWADLATTKVCPPFPHRRLDDWLRFRPGADSHSGRFRQDQRTTYRRRRRRDEERRRIRRATKTRCAHFGSKSEYGSHRGIPHRRRNYRSTEEGEEHL